MNLDLLHSTCKKETRLAFDEFKRQIEDRLFPFTEDLKDNLQQQMLQQMGMGVIKTMFKDNVSKKQLEIINSVLNEYERLAIKTSNKYSKKFL